MTLLAMAKAQWVVIGLCLLGVAQLGSAVESIPDGVVVTAGNCSLFAFTHCVEGSQGCVDLDDDQYYCHCLDDALGDGRKNGTGCGKLVFSCADDDDCHPNAVCTNSSCECKPGFERNGSACIDIDECAADPCVANSICSNSLGYYNCTCKPSFELVDDKCVFRCKVDQDCHDDGKCVNEHCVCEPGYEGDGINMCNDINECTNGTYECDSDADCVNENGSYSCDCHNGYDGDGKTCVKLPTSCQEIYEDNNSAKSDTYTIDTDGTGEQEPITVKCEMRDGMGITIIYPDDESIRQSPNGGGVVPVPYPATPDQIKPLVNNSGFCSQEFWAKCRSGYNLPLFVTWEDGSGNTRTSWGTDQEGMCPCGVLGVCKNPASKCNCDGSNSGREVDAGYVINKDLLPVTVVNFGNTNKRTDYTIGPLKCGPKPIDILKDCSEIRAKQNIKLSGPQLIDVDGPDSPLDPVLVYCDMETYPNIGVTVITPDGPPKVEFTESGTRPVNYSIPMDVIEALIQGSVHCDQAMEYQCQGGKQDVTVNVGGDDRELDYLPGGIPDVPGSCGCGVTNTCDELDAPCNCAIDDGQTRRDIGVQIDRSDLPIVSITAQFNGQKKGVSVLRSLRCSSSQFGIEPNCEKYRSLGYNFTYTYLIDPDGAPKPDGAAARRRRRPRRRRPRPNVVPFRAYCIMNVEPPMGITVIHHKIRESLRLGGGNWSLDFLYPYVSPEQLDALRTRCTYVRQHIKLSCDKFALHPESGTRRKRRDYAYWKRVASDIKRFYWSGNGSSENCKVADGSDACQCDKSETSSTVMIDQGDLTNKNHIPFGLVNFEQANVDGNGHVDMELGPFQCFEVFTTCAAVFKTAQGRARYGELLPDDGAFTIDPDGSGPVPAFQVDCDFPFTTLPSLPKIETLTNNGTDSITKCFDISYLDGVGNTLSSDQIVSLVEASNGNCKQSLSLTCNNAPITDLIYFETCGGGKQTGWAGSGGRDTCACGLTGTCEGDVNRKCNCDIEDSTERSDGGMIIDNDRLPICRVCITLEGTSSTGAVSPPPRSASFQVSDLVCSKNKLGVNTNCQKASIGSSPSDSGTMYIRGDPDPIPVYCDFRPYPPAGVLLLFPNTSNITIPPDEDFEMLIVYKVFNMTQLVPLISKFEYCKQKLEITCQDASLNIQGEYGWYSRDNAIQNYWNNPESGGPCSGNGGQCNCNLPGNQTDGGYIVDQSALPVTRIKFQASSGTRNVFLGPMECYDIKKDCYEIMKSGDKSTVYWSNSTYIIKPDGAGPLEPFLVTCEFDEENDNAVTIAYPADSFPQVISGRDSEPFKITLSYQGASPEQLEALAKHSQFCMQGVLYDCRQSPVGNVTLAGGQQANGFGVADDIAAIGCPCHKLGTCGSEEVCRCNNKGIMGDFDRGYFTEKDVLPVTSATFGGQDSETAVGKLTISELKCSKKPKDLPKTCAEAKEMGMVTGEILVYPTPYIDKPFLVFCDMSIGSGVARVKPVDEPDRPVNRSETEVPYKGLTDDQLKALIAVSEYCYQPVLVDCYRAGFISDGYFSWSGPDGAVHHYWGNGIPSENSCTCGAEGLCGGDGGKDEMSKRKCNCDIGDAVWRKDGGVMRIKEHLPVRKYTWKSPGFGFYAEGNITIGELYCGMEEIDLPVCQMEFDDCADLAVCEEESISEFECVCPKGYQGHVNGQGINDLWANGRQCYDDDECSYFACPYSADCFNLPGDFNCTCKPGYIKTGKTTCQDINECASDDDNDCDENARCVNTKGSYDCRCRRGYIGDGRTCEPQGKCACYGDPHCLSFDQKWLHFMGLCEYTMSRDNCDGGEATFEVIIQNWRKDRPTTASWVKKVLVIFQGTRVELRQGRQVLVNGELKSAFTSPELRVADYGREVKLMTNTGIIVTWDGQDAVEVSVGKFYKGKLCGLCGNYNDDMSDDWKRGPVCPDVPGPQITDNNNLFGNSWSTSQIGNGDSQCNVDCDSPPSNKVECEMDSVFATILCDSILKAAKSPFKSCIPKLEPSIMPGYHASCQEDMCRSPDTNMGNLCDVAGRIAKECEDIGEKVPVWQNINNLNCGGECGENMKHSFCGGKNSTDPGPVQTCIGLRTNTPPNSSPSCVPGCFCKKNFYLDGTKCVPEDECGCIYTSEGGETSYMEPGETHVYDGCGSYRICSKGNVIENETLVCSPNASCGLDNETGIYGCHCDEGFMGDGETCEVDPCANVTCPENQECKEGECVCKMGFTADCDQCVDIDECATKTHNCTWLGQVCVNTPGGYYCSCEEGYLQSNGRCVDFDECEHGRDGCPDHSECQNTKGSFRCLCCAGFRMVNSVCITDGTGFDLLGDKGKCCYCTHRDCDKPGKVCGTNGKTYNSLKEMIIKSCKNNEIVRKNYDGPCLDSCEVTECPRPGQVCSIENDKARCRCPSCSESDYNTTLESVCSSTHLMFKSRCMFDKYRCGLPQSEITIVSTGKACEGSGAGMPMGQWTPWSECSVTCGSGFVSRSRIPIEAAKDASGNPLKETTLALCYKTCPEGPCTTSACPEFEVCNEDSSPNGFSCLCPNCTFRGDDPVCGRVGNFVKTYVNLCELEKDACVMKLPMTVVQDFACEAQPRECSKMFNLETRKDSNGCESINMDFGKCGGGCGEDPSKCCVPNKEPQSVQVRCVGGQPYNATFDVVTSCSCMDQSESTTTEATTTTTAVVLD